MTSSPGDDDRREFAAFLREHEYARDVVAKTGVGATFPVGTVGSDVFARADAAGFRPGEVDARDGGVFVAFVPRRADEVDP